VTQNVIQKVAQNSLICHGRWRLLCLVTQYGS